MPLTFSNVTSVEVYVLFALSTRNATLWPDAGCVLPRGPNSQLAHRFERWMTPSVVARLKVNVSVPVAGHVWNAPTVTAHDDVGDVEICMPFEVRTDAGV